jgi:hypothetical protein
MSYRLPSGKLIDQTKKGAYFIVDGVRHNETSLDKWDDETLAKYGITKEPTPKPVIYEPDVTRLREIRLNLLRNDVTELLNAHHGTIVRAALQVLDPAVHPTVFEDHISWVAAVLTEYWDYVQQLNSAQTREEVYAITPDFSVFMNTVPKTDFGALLKTGGVKRFTPSQTKEV